MHHSKTPVFVEKLSGFVKIHFVPGDILTEPFTAHQMASLPAAHHYPARGRDLCVKIQYRDIVTTTYFFFQIDKIFQGGNSFADVRGYTKHIQFSGPERIRD